MTRLTAFLQDYAMTLAFGPALTAMLGSLYYSEIAGFVPCTLCWYQRILMYPLSLIILVGVLSEDDFLPRYVLPLSLTGMFVSGYHYLLQLGIVGHSSLCQAGVPCNVRYINYLGFVTIPFLALTAFTLINLLFLVAIWARRQELPEQD